MHRDQPCQACGVSLLREFGNVNIEDREGRRRAGMICGISALLLLYHISLIVRIVDFEELRDASSGDRAHTPTKYVSIHSSSSAALAIYGCLEAQGMP